VLPAVGTVVEVAQPDRGVRRRSRVEHVAAMQVWVVAPLHPAGEAWPLEPGTALELTWATERGVRTAHGALDRVEQDTVAVWVVTVARVEETQRREAYRLDLALPAHVVGSSFEVAGTLRDLSETGVRLRLPASTGLALGDEIRVEVELGSEGAVGHRGRVVRLRTGTPNGELGHDELEAGVRLLQLEREDVERLRRFVFEEQLRRRRHDGAH
jgi:c-di-GMP-binding flagellar brake protein YcgR